METKEGIIDHLGDLNAHAFWINKLIYLCLPAAFCKLQHLQ